MDHNILTTIFIFQSHLNTQDNQTQAALDAGGDTDPATDTEETYATPGTKRKAPGSTDSA